MYYNVLEIVKSNKPFKGVLAFCPEKVNVGLKLQFEDVLLVNTVWLFGGADRVAKQGEASQREVVLQAEMETLSENRATLTPVTRYKCHVLSQKP